jgi:hypothetical protein
MNNIPALISNMTIESILELIMCIRESLWLRNRGRQRVPACDNNANGSDMSKIRRSIDNRQLLSHGMGYVRYMWLGCNRTGRRTNSLVRHCNADDCLHCQLTGEGTSMRFGVHFLKHVFMIHIRFELKCKVGRRRCHCSKIGATWNKRSRQNGAQLVKRTRTDHNQHFP